MTFVRLDSLLLLVFRSWCTLQAQSNRPFLFGDKKPRIEAGRGGQQAALQRLQRLALAMRFGGAQARPFNRFGQLFGRSTHATGS